MTNYNMYIIAFLRRVLKHRNGIEYQRAKVQFSDKLLSPKDIAI